MDPGLAWSRAAAMSGMRPRRKKREETVKYVVTANTSQTRGERKFGHSIRSLG
jgi:hypothetical protein